MPPKRKLSRTRKAMELARKRKPTGRLNKEDIENALASLKLTPGLVGAPGVIKKMLKDPGMSSDKLKANVAMW